MAQPEETRSGFLLRNLLKGLLYLGLILIAFILAQDFIQENFNRHIVAIEKRPVLMFSIFFASEVIFGIIPPVLFMSTWKLLMNIDLNLYITYQVILAVLSFIAGVIGFFVGKYFSQTLFYKRIEERYLLRYNKQLKKYGVFLVLVGSVTPIPFSGTCMLAGSVRIPFKAFLSACACRVFYFLIYGYIVWAFPNLFS